MGVTLKLTLDKTDFKKFKKEFESKKIDVGWLKPTDHWSDSNKADRFNLPMLASHLHHWSPWRNSFMFDHDYTSEKQLSHIYTTSAERYLGNTPVSNFCNKVGKFLQMQLRANIEGVSSPLNSPAWAEQKGFNDPLLHGGALGIKPSLLSDVNYEVRS